MALTQGFQSDRRLYHSIAQIAQGLPERGAAAGTFLDAGERLRAGLAGPDDLPQRLFKKKVVAQLTGAPLASACSLSGQLVKCQQLNIEQRKTPLPAQ